MPARRLPPTSYLPVCPPTGRPRRPPTHPLLHEAVPDASRDGGGGEMFRLVQAKTNRGNRRAYTQLLVTTWLLDNLHDPIAQISRLQRIYPRAWLNDNPLMRCLDFSETPVINLLRYMARGLFVSAYDVREESSRSGTDSDLEAFSHNPANGSVAALPCQTAAKTNYLNQRFLSY